MLVDSDSSPAAETATAAKTKVVSKPQELIVPHTERPPKQIEVAMSSSVNLRLPGAEMMCLINGEWERLCGFSQRDVNHAFTS